MNKVYISNVKEDVIIANIPEEIKHKVEIHRLICDRQYEGLRKEKHVVAILFPSEYSMYKKNGYYLVE